MNLNGEIKNLTILIYYVYKLKTSYILFLKLKFS